jgi:hypothetical protein
VNKLQGLTASLRILFLGTFFPHGARYRAWWDAKVTDTAVRHQVTREQAFAYLYSLAPRWMRSRLLEYKPQPDQETGS